MRVHEEAQDFDLTPHCRFVHPPVPQRHVRAQRSAAPAHTAYADAPFSSMSMALIFFLFRILMATLCPVSACSAIFTCARNGGQPRGRTRLSAWNVACARAWQTRGARARTRRNADTRGLGARVQAATRLAEGADAQRLAHAVVGQVELRGRGRMSAVRRLQRGGTWASVPPRLVRPHRRPPPPWRRPRRTDLPGGKRQARAGVCGRA